MGTLNRRDLLEQLQIVLAAVTGVITAIRSYKEIDITQYTAAQLPLVNIIEPLEDNDEEMISRRSMQYMDLRLKVWFVNWGESPTDAYETLIKNIRDGLGEKFTLNDTATACWVVSVSLIEGEMPVYNFEISLRVKYYLNQLET